MPKSKVINIDEITSPKDGASSKSHRPASGQKSQRGQRKSSSSNSANPLSSLGWKTALTFKITQWFIFLRSKSYGKWIIVPAVILAILLIIPIGVILILWFLIKSLFQQLTRR